MTRDEKALPGELIIRFLAMIMLTALWAAIPFVQIGRGIAWLRRRQLGSDIAFCCWIGAIIGIGLLFL